VYYISVYAMAEVQKVYEFKVSEYSALAGRFVL
jgi:hypothetical protein